MDGLLATKSKSVGLIIPAISFFPRFPSYVGLIHQRHRQKDGRTDDVQSQYRVLHYSASRGKKKVHIKMKKTFYTFMIVRNAMSPPSGGRAGLHCCLRYVGIGNAKQEKRLTKKDNSSSCFDNL